MKRNYPSGHEKRTKRNNMKTNMEKQSDNVSATKMDVSAQLERAIEEMKRRELLSSFLATINIILASIPDPPAPPPPVPAELELNTQPQPIESQDGGYGANPLMAAPTVYNGLLHQEDIMQPGHLRSQTGVYSQGQCNSEPMVMLSEGQSLHCVGVLNGEMVYKVIAADFAPLNIFNTPKARPYVKKPPNAFMLFIKEQKANVQADLNMEGRGSAAINTVLGQRWNSLTEEEQIKYYNKAEEERLLHAQRHPEWSTSDNYGKKSKRQRRKFPTRAEASAEDTQQAVMEPSSSLVVEAPQTYMMEPRDLQTVLQLPNTETAVTVPVCHVCHLPQVYDVSPAFWLGFPQRASTSLASHAALTPTETTESTHSEVSPSYLNY